MLPPPLPPSTFSANVSPILAQQSLPGPSQPQQPFYRAPPSTSTHVYGRSPPPAPLHTHSPPSPNLGHPYGTVHQLPNPNSPPYTQYQQQASLAGPARSPPMGSSSAANGPKPRGRKPKNYVKSAEEERVEREEYLERNRLAALKSRQRKKQKMGNLEARA